MDEELKTKETNKDERKGFNITSLILGIMALVLVCIPYLSIPCAIISIIFGILGINKTGKGMGIAGLICSIISVLLLVVFWVWIFIGVGINNTLNEGIIDKSKDAQNKYEETLKNENERMEYLNSVIENMYLDT